VFNKKIKGVNAFWFGEGDETLQRFGREVIRRVSPEALNEARRAMLHRAYARLSQLQNYNTIVGTLDLMLPIDDSSLQEFLDKLPRAEIEDTRCDDELRTMLAESAKSAQCLDHMIQ
jgi:hypothetical protein